MHSKTPKVASSSTCAAINECSIATHGSVRRQPRNARSLDDRSENASRERAAHRRSRAGVSALQPELVRRNRIVRLQRRGCGQRIPVDSQTRPADGYVLIVRVRCGTPRRRAVLRCARRREGGRRRLPDDVRVRRSEPQERTCRARCAGSFRSRRLRRCICRRACRMDSTAVGFPTAQSGPSV